MSIRVLLLDLETAPNKAFVWGLFNVNVGADAIEEPGYTLCWAAKWLGEDKIMFGKIIDKKDFLKRIYDLLNEADVVVTYNGIRFDLPTISKDFVLRGWAPPAPYQQVDLLRVVRKQFRFPSNKLSYVSQALGLGAKHAHKGLGLWKEVMQGDKEAWKEMETYNKQDVNLLELLYYKLIAWIPAHPNYALFDNGEEPSCPSCGGTHLQRRGHYSTKTMQYQRFQCQDCGTWSRLRTNDVPKGKRANILVNI